MIILTNIKNLIKTSIVFSNKLINTIRFKNTPPSKIISTKEYARNNNYFFNLIDNEYIIIRTPPLTIDTQPHWKFRMGMETNTPEVYLAKMKNVFVAKLGTIYSGDGYLLGDVSKEIGVPIERHSILNQGNLPEAKKKSGTLAVINRHSNGNYYHFLFDELPRFSLIDELSDYYYIPNDKKFMKEYLEIIGIPTEKMISPKKNTIFTADEVIVPSSIGITGNPTYRAVEYIRSQTLKIQEVDNPISPKRIYISRRDAKTRKLLNESLIEKILRQYGFVTVTLDGMHVKKEIELFSNADIIISVHGAGLSNIVYAKPETKVIEFFSPLYVNVCFWSLANICNLQYGYIIGEGKMPQEGIDPHRVYTNLTLSPEKVEKILQVMRI